jgi:virulence-associated protein VagC
MVHIPPEFELPGDEAVIRREGDRLVIEPVRKRGLIALLWTMAPLDEEFPPVARATGLIIVRANADEFRRVRGLNVENWLG